MGTYPVAFPCTFASFHLNIELVGLTDKGISIFQ